MARRCPGDRLAGVEGTYFFMSPECFFSREEYSGKASDVWSLGVTLYCLGWLRLPWHGTDDRDIVPVYQAILDGARPDFEAPSGLPSEFVDLVRQMLTVDWRRRISMQQIASHPFLAGADG